MARHAADHRTRIDTARQECADRHIADHLHSHRFGNLLAHTLGPLRLGDSVVDLLRQAPVAPLAHLPRLDRQQRGGRQLAHALEDAMRCGDVAQMQVAGHGSGVQLGPHAGQGEQRLCLGGERDAPAVLHDVKRLHAQAVAADQQAPPPCVPQREREHPVQTLHESVAFCVVQMQQDFTVGPGLEAVAFGLQLGTQFAEVVDLAVAHQPERFLEVRQRLMASGKIDDRQAAHRDAAFSVDVHAFIVGTAVPREIPHR